MNTYCFSRFRTVRRPTREVMIGEVGVGGDNPIRVQSMTTSDTKDVAATVKESIALAEAGCEIIRITAPNKTAAACLKPIKEELLRHKIKVPLVADIHFLPAAAMEAVEHVEKVRINPGNYADRKKFAVREYSDDQYREEMDRLYETFSPIVKRCKELGRSMRIGTNHGSLSDRIMNRYGDTPRGMVESALEFIRIAESHGFRDIILSMKASNPKVMIEAYRLLVHQMEKEAMFYPLHLGVTEAGDGEDGRVKSAIGIGSLLTDGLGDTIRVSLTEDSVYEIPVARALADKAMSQWTAKQQEIGDNDELYLDPNRRVVDSVDPFAFAKRPVPPIALGENLLVATTEPPRVVLPYDYALAGVAGKGLPEDLQKALAKNKDNPIEALLLSAKEKGGVLSAIKFGALVKGRIPALFLDLGDRNPSEDEWSALAAEEGFRFGLLRTFSTGEGEALAGFLEACSSRKVLPVLAIAHQDFAELGPALQAVGAKEMIFTLAAPETGCHAVGAYRLLAENLRVWNLEAPIWIRNRAEMAFSQEPGFLDQLLEASILQGSLLCDGMGDLVSVETVKDPLRAQQLTYNVLQGAGSRISRTEFVACPSCGRTLFNLQTTTQRIREKTGHLKGVKIAVMGCIVNGPGEMADADFGYVGGAPKKVNLYVGKECVQFHVPEEEADQRLIELIKEHGKWTDPEPAEAGESGK
ncbi:MAG: (E)-4-hydroxy-3-methylbut-2-enyl-diphosphate synthase [Opitutales bacterium]|nr:(E)-4-hydroxy-3-methylbut-2-enyl-diphosphate synthase [Opitutales bacterium]